MRREIVIIEKALDKYVARMRAKGIDPRGFQLKTLAASARMSRHELSHMVQQYRKLQAAGRTKYVVACEGYGTEARWKILAGPTSSPAVKRAALVKHVEWSMRDAVQRFMRDRLREIAPALVTSGVLEAEITNALDFATGNLEALLVFVEREVEVIAKRHGLSLP